MAFGSARGRRVHDEQCRVEARRRRWYPTFMLRVRAVVMLVVLVTVAPAAWGQPVDPYAPTAPAAPAPRTPAPTAAPAPKTPTPAPAPAAPAPAPAAPAPTTPSPVPASPGPVASPAPPAASDAPQDPYAPAPGQDPQLTDRVAQVLVTRAQELLDAGSYLDAKQLAVEALVKNPRGGSAARAREIVRTCNRELGIPELAPPEEAPARSAPAPLPVEDADTTPIRDPTLPIEAPAALPPPEGAPRRGRLTSVVHGALYVGLLGTTIGAFVSDEAPAGAVPIGLAAGLGGALVIPRLTDRLRWSEARVRAVGSATVWGGVVGGLFGDIGKTEESSGRQILVAASIGSTLAGLGGYALTRSRTLTRGDVALIDTLAGMGAVGGLTLGMVMQPIESEAYSLNAVLGVTAGVFAGAIIGPQTNTTPRRMARVAGAAAVGGALPFLLYAAISDAGSTADERVTGLLSTGGLLAGAYLGLRFTRGMDAGLDTDDGARGNEREDAPVALIGRSSAGRWGLGGLGLAPLSPVLAPQRGMALQLVGATF
jgi:hypothetical protein